MKKLLRRWLGLEETDKMLAMLIKRDVKTQSKPAVAKRGFHATTRQPAPRRG